MKRIASFPSLFPLLALRYEPFSLGCEASFDKIHAFLHGPSEYTLTYMIS